MGSKKKPVKPSRPQAAKEAFERLLKRHKVKLDISMIVTTKSDVPQFLVDFAEDTE